MEEKAILGKVGLAAMSWVLATQMLYAQQVLVVDTATHLALAHCYISHGHDRYVITNYQGKADLSQFVSVDTLIVQRFGYHPKTLVRPFPATIQLVATANTETGRVVISANRWEQDLATVPNQLLDLSGQIISERQPPTTAELLAEAGVFVQKSQQGGGSPMLRGFAANSIFTAENILDVYYRTYSSAIGAPGRHVQIALSYALDPSKKPD